MNRAIYGVILGWMCLIGTAIAAPGLGIDLVVDLETKGGTPESAVSAALVQLCPEIEALPSRSTEQQQLLDVCNALDSSATTTNERGQALKAISSRSASSETSAATYLPAGASASIPTFGKRLAALRRSSEHLKISRYHRPLMLASLDASGLQEEPQSSRVSGFVTANLSSFEQQETSNEAGFSGDGQGLVLGADYRLSNQLFAGIALNQHNNSADLASNTGSLTASDTGLTFYGTYSMSDLLYFDGVVNLSSQSYELERNISFTSAGQSFNEKASSKPNGSALALNLAVGWQHVWLQGTNLDVTGKFSYSQTSIDSFRESGAGGLNLSVDGQDINSTRLNLGASVSHPLSTTSGIIVPQASLHWVHELDNSGQDITAHFVSDPNANEFKYTTNERDSDFFTLGLGASMLTPGGITAFIQYETLLDLDNYTQNAFSLGARMEF